MIKAVIFDFDDTLVKTREIKWEHHKAVAKKFYNIELLDEKLEEHWGEPFDELITHLYENADTVENMRAANRSIEADFPKVLYEHSLSVVDKLFKAGILLGILSSTNREYVKLDMERLGFPVEQFFNIQGADETIVHKPNPAVFDMSISKLSEHGISQAEAVYVGDAMIDYQAANQAGLGFIAVTTGLFGVEHFVEQGVEQVLQDLSELPAVIFQ